MARYKKLTTLEREFKKLTIEEMRAKLESYRKGIEFDRCMGNVNRSSMERKILEHNFLVKILRAKKLEEIQLKGEL